MSLWGRLLLVIVLMNLLVLLVILATSRMLQNWWLVGQKDQYQKILQTQYQDVLPRAIQLQRRQAYPATVKRILELGTFRHKFKDILITQVLPFGYGTGKVDLNPLGTLGRDHDSFPLAEIRAGIRQAMQDKTLVAVGEGLCVPIYSSYSSYSSYSRDERRAGGGGGGHEVVAGAWFVSLFPQPPQLPFLAYALPVLFSILIFAVLANWIVRRTIGRPMQALGDAARRMAAADYSGRVPRVGSAPEFNLLVEAFNTMAQKVEGHTDELSREVQRATEEAAAKERALLVSSRLASVGTLAAGIAHEINNPIGGMLNALSRIARNSELDERERRYVELLQEGLERVAATSRKMLDFSPREIQAVAFPLAQAVQGAQALVEHRLQRQNIHFELSIPDDLPLLFGEPHEIQQVLLNLFLNSLNALSKQQEGRIRVSARRHGEGTLIRVEDDGPGVDAETLARVMDPFFSSQDRPHATGLGLFICYTIIGNHGGRLSIASEPGKGFSVEIQMPQAPPRG